MGVGEEGGGLTGPRDLGPGGVADPLVEVLRKGSRPQTQATSPPHLFFL